MLDEDTYERLTQYKESGGQLEVWRDGGWKDVDRAPRHDSSFPFRAKPEPKTTVRYLKFHIDPLRGWSNLEVAKQNCTLFDDYIFLRVERDEDDNLISVDVEKDQ